MAAAQGGPVSHLWRGADPLGAEAATVCMCQAAGMECACCLHLHRACCIWAALLQHNCQVCCNFSAIPDGISLMLALLLCRSMWPGT